MFQQQPLPTSVENVAALSTSLARTANGGIVRTTGYRTAGDGGGNSFVYHSTGRAANSIVEDGIFYFDGPGSDDYFEAEDKSVIDISKLGASPDLADNTAILTAAIALAGDKEILIPEGTYTCLSGISVTLKSVTIRGLGAKSKLSWPTSYQGIAIDVTLCPKFELHNLALSGGNQNAKGVYVRSSSSEAVVQNCEIYGFCGNDGTVSQAQLYCEDVSKCLVTDNKFHSASDMAVNGVAFTADSSTDVFTSVGHGLSDSDAVIFSGSDLPAGLFPYVTYFVRDSTADTFKVEKVPSSVAVDITDNGSGTLLFSTLPISDDVAFYNCGEVICTNNNISSRNRSGVQFGGSVLTDTDAIVSANFIKDHLSHGIGNAYGGYLNIRMVISGNRIHNCGLTGIYQFGPGESALGVSTIANNVITNCSGRYFWDQAGNGGIFVSGLKGGSIVGNVIQDSGFDDSGIEVGGPGRGIFIVGASDCVIAGNQVKNSSYSGIQVSTGYNSTNLLITGNLVVDAPRLIHLVASGPVKHRNILISNNSLVNDAVDGNGLHIDDYGNGCEICFTDNLVKGNGSATTHGIYSINETYAKSRFTGNEITNWTYGFYVYNGYGTSTNFAVGELWYLEGNLFDSVTNPFYFYVHPAAVGSKNRFVNCEPNFSNVRIPASFENGRLVGYFKDSLPSLGSFGDRLMPYTPAAGVGSAFVNLAALPSGVAFTNTGDTINATAHGLSVGSRVRVTGGSLPTPLVSGKEYYVKTVADADHVTLQEIAGLYSSIATITLTSSGSGTIQQLSYSPDWVSVATDAITETSANLEDVAAAINTSGKFAGKQVFNVTTSKPVFAVGASAASVWADATGSTAHTPV